jgi:cyclopropane fatty-acyl-phospholipid synthase-like methyltransferase
MFYLVLVAFILCLQIITCLVFSSTSVLTNVNTLLTLTVWFGFIYAAHVLKNKWLLLGPFLLLLANELLYVNFDLDGFNGPARTQLMYDLTTIFFINTCDNNTNLTEGVYLTDIKDNSSLMTEAEAKKLDPAQANRNKFDKFLLFANIDPKECEGLRVLDMGCGNGDFIKYCNSLGMKTSGMSISGEQVKAMKAQHLDVYVGSYREMQPQFIGKYDVVTFWGSLEHVTQSYPCSKSGEKKAEREILNIMSHVKQYYDPESPYKLLFNTTLHMNKELCEGTLNSYIIERTYGGWYFYDEPKQTLSDKIEPIGFKKTAQEDFTFHYYMASKIDPSHFGCPAQPTFFHLAALFLGLFINPIVVAMTLYTMRGEWMWQFDNKTHLFDAACETCSLLEREKRPTTLLWSLNKLDAPKKKESV